jgi:hypothetical protein
MTDDHGKFVEFVTAGARGDLAFELRSFMVRLAVSGSPKSVIQSGVNDLLPEIEKRTHIRNPHTHWDELEGRIIVELELDEFTATRAEESAAEQLLEIASTTLGDYDVFQIDIIKSGLTDGSDGGT